MRFHIPMLFALAVTTQLASAAPAPAPVPEPAWNDKDHEANYKFGAIVCVVGALVCNKAGVAIGQDLLAAGGVCCSTMAAAVTASQAEGWQGRAQKLGAAAQVGKDKTVAGGKLVAAWASNKWTIIASKVTGARSIDGEYLEERDINALYPSEDTVLISRSPEAHSEVEKERFE